MSHYRLKLTSLSPVHIGTADGELSPMEFFVKNDHVYITSENCVVNALVKENLADSFYMFCQNEGRPSLSSYLDTLNWKQRADIEKNIVIRKIPIANNLTGLPSLRPHVSNLLDSTAYIPGSTIKGALRCALLYLLCQSDGRELKKIVSSLPNARRNWRQGFAANLDRFLLQNVNVPGVKKQGPQTDWLKSLKVSDAFTETKDCTEVVPVKVVSLTDKNYHFGANNATIYVEAVSSGTTFTCEVAVDEFLEKRFTRFNRGKKVFDFTCLLENLGEKFDRVFNKDKKFFSLAALDSMQTRYDMLSKWGANFRLGWGSGLLSTTLGLLLDDAERRELRQAFYLRRNNPNFPQSRKVVVKRNAVVDTLGWFNLSWEKIG